MNIIEQLVKVYQDNELGNYGVLTDLETERYYSSMLGNGRIQTLVEHNNLLGFIESWRVNFEQLGRIVCWTNFSALKEDITKGDIAWVSDIWVAKDRRGDGEVAKRLIEMFKEANQDALYFLSQRVKTDGKAKYIRVYDKANGYKLNKEN